MTLLHSLNYIASTETVPAYSLACSTVGLAKFAMPLAALWGHVIVAYCLRLDFERKCFKSDLCKREFQI